MYTKENPPEWATHVIIFDREEGGGCVLYNKERWLYVTNNEVDEGIWEEEGDLEGYLERPVVRNAKIEELNIQLENE